MMIKTLIAAVIAVVLLVGCGGVDEPSPRLTGTPVNTATSDPASAVDRAAEVESEQAVPVREFVDMWLLNLDGPSGDPLAADVTPEGFCQNVAGNGRYLTPGDIVDAFFKGWSDAGWADAHGFTPNRQVVEGVLRDACRDLMF